ncbi:MAG: hypothetical protein J5745_03290 [Bacteroidales bacterium]|nr:hypothetical protein [Bacteroidales bacterium]
MKRYLSFLLIMLPLFSCHKENAEVEPQKDIAFVSIHSFATKAQIGTNALPAWSEGDAVSVLGDASNTPAEFTLRTGAGYSVAAFEGFAPAGEKYIVCSPSDAKCDGETYRGKLPTQVKHSVPVQPLGALPLWGETGDLSSVSLECLCGILRVNLKGNVALKSVTLDAGKAVSGEFMYNIKEKLFAMIGGANVINMDASKVELLENKAIPFHFILPPGEYEDITLTIVDADGETYYITVDDTVQIDAGTFTSLSYDLKDF